MFQLPDGFQVRPPTLDDVGITVDLSNSCQQRTYGVSEANEEDTLAFWRSANIDLARDGWLVFNLHNQLVACLLLGHKEPLHMQIVLRIHPDYTDRGLEGPLLECVEERARQCIPQLRPGARISLYTQCSNEHLAYRQAIMLLGFTHVRTSWRMEIKMHEHPPVPVWPAGIALRPFTREMARLVHAVDEEGFRDHWGYTPMTFAAFERWLIATSHFDPTLWFLPFEDETLVGAALCERRADFVWINSLSILRPWRRRGLGLALVYHALGEFWRRNQPEVALYVDAQSLTGATRLYERASMRVVRQLDRYEKELRPGIELSTQTLRGLD